MRYHVSEPGGDRCLQLVWVLCVGGRRCVRRHRAVTVIIILV